MVVQSKPYLPCDIKNKDIKLCLVQTQTELLFERDFDGGHFRARYGTTHYWLAGLRQAVGTYLVYALPWPWLSIYPGRVVPQVCFWCLCLDLAMAINAGNMVYGHGLSNNTRLVRPSSRLIVRAKAFHAPAAADLIPTRVHSFLHSSMQCGVNMMLHAFTCWNLRDDHLFPGSIPVEGSWRSPPRAWLRLLPPLSDPANLYPKSKRFICLSFVCTKGPISPVGTPLVCSSRCLRTIRLSTSAYCGQ